MEANGYSVDTPLDEIFSMKSRKKETTRKAKFNSARTPSFRPSNSMEVFFVIFWENQEKVSGATIPKTLVLGRV